MDAKQVPLRELLASVPADARLVIDDADGKGTRFIPVGRLCQEAAAALAEPVQEPVADQFADVSKMVQEPVAWTHINGTSDTKRHQPQRKPLTEEKLWEMWVESPSDVLRFARAVERAHGIGEHR